MIKQQRFKLNLQLFAEGGTGESVEGGEPTGTDTKPEKMISKAKFDKLASENAELKRKLRGTQSEEQRHADVMKEKDDEIATLRKQVNFSNIKEGLSVGGLSGEGINSIVDAFINQDEEAFTKGMNDYFKKINDDHNRVIESIKLDTTPRPGEGTNGGEEKVITKDDFNKMTYLQQIEFKQKNPELAARYLKK